MAQPAEPLARRTESAAEGGSPVLGRAASYGRTLHPGV